MESDNAPTQMDISAATKVDQGLISKVLHCKVSRWTARIARIDEYVSNQHKARLGTGAAPALPAEVVTMVESYIQAGCDIDLLRRQLDILQAAQSER